MAALLAVAPLSGYGDQDFFPVFNKAQAQKEDMKMMDRRTFLRTACAAVGTFATVGLMGCSGAEENATGSNVENAAEPVSATASEAPSPQSAPSASTGSAAVVYFSATGNTRSVAEKIMTATGANLEEIVPAEPYSAADIDYNTDCRANDEQNDASARPAIAAPIPNVDDANIVFLGYPIWWGTAPRIIETFLEDVDLAGKTVVPFCTSGSSPISGSLSAIEQAAPNAIWEDGKRFSASASQQEVDEWVAGILG